MRKSFKKQTSSKLQEMMKQYLDLFLMIQKILLHPNLMDPSSSTPALETQHCSVRSQTNRQAKDPLAAQQKTLRGRSVQEVKVFSSKTLPSYLLYPNNQQCFPVLNSVPVLVSKSQLFNGSINSML